MNNEARVSQKLKIKLFLSGRRHYQVAHEAGLSPALFSRVINGIEKLKPNDARVLAIGSVLGVPPSECFETRR